MEFTLLGTVAITEGGVDLAIGGAKPRTLLAALLVEHGHVVPAERLLDAVWGSRPPDRARAILQTYVSTIRHLIRGASAGSAIATRPPGYVLDIGTAQLDRDIFERLVGQGRQAAAERRYEEAADILRTALARWRGPALGGADSDLLAGEAARLDELRLTTVEERITVDMAVGRLADVAAELTDLVRRHPFRERMRGQLMTALCGLGRQTEALRVYREGRTNLVEELGIEPGPELRAIHAHILNGGVTFASGTRISTPPRRNWIRPSPTPGWHVPAQLPPAPGDLTGRATEVATLTGALTRTNPAGPARVQLIIGRGGVGKSTLAAQVAHQAAPEFPDGQLYADLHGPTGTPADPHEVLGRFIRALDPTSTYLPDATVERAERYRTLLAGRRLLVVLDDARNECQIRPLLPGAVGCGVLVTSRRRLTGLAGAETTELDVLPDAQARTLFSSIIGYQRAAAEPAAVDQIVRCCAGLPLALRVAGARLASRRSWPVQLLADRLTHDDRLRLTELTAGDQGVRDCIHRSYGELDTVERAALRVGGLLGLHDFPSWLLASALDVPGVEAERVLEGLVDLHLVDPVRVDALGQVRYGLHELVRLFGQERAVAEEPRDITRVAVSRVVAGWSRLVEAVRTGRGRLGTTRRTATPELPVAGAVWSRILADPATWCAVERDAWASTATLARTVGLDMPIPELNLRRLMAIGTARDSRLLQPVAG